MQHERQLVGYLMRVRLKEIQNDNYDQHKRSLQNEAQKLCKREQQHLLHRISRVQSLQALSCHTTLGESNQQEHPFVTFRIYEEGHIEIVDLV
jgi:hypothetical protein